MPLSSPRFRDNAELRRVESGQLLLKKGARGRHVHLVQMALLDLGHRMPRSTGSQSYSPDGIYGDETVATVHAFQRAAPSLSADGIVGPKTLRELDRRFGSFTHRVGLHFRAIALTNVSFDRILRSTKAVYAQYGIRIEMLNGESLALDSGDQARLERVDQRCRWNLTTGEFNELHARGAPAPSTDVLVYFIDSFNPQLLGCGGHAPNRPACTVAKSGTQWTVAHEVGHVMLGSGFAPVHVNDSRNLMNRTTSTITSLPTLTDKQIARIRASAVCKSA
jgi:hypothetical protein